MDVRIGVQHTVKEIELELPDDVDRHHVRSDIEKALENEANVLWLTDRNGAEVAVPAGKIAYVHLGRSDGERRIGFGS